MNCKLCQKFLFEYLDGALPPKKERKILDHLSGCADCSAFIEQEKVISPHLKRALERYSSSLLPDIDLVERIMKEKDNDKKRIPAPWKFRLVLKPVSMAVVFLAAVIIFTVVLVRRPEKEIVNLAKQKNVSLDAKEKMIEEPRANWLKRHLILTIIDDKQNMYERIITKEEVSLEY